MLGQRPPPPPPTHTLNDYKYFLSWHYVITVISPVFLSPFTQNILLSMEEYAITPLSVQKTRARPKLIPLVYVFRTREPFLSFFAKLLALIPSVWKEPEQYSGVQSFDGSQPKTERLGLFFLELWRVNSWREVRKNTNENRALGSFASEGRLTMPLSCFHSLYRLYEAISIVASNCVRT